MFRKKYVSVLNYLSFVREREYISSANIKIINLIKDRYVHFFINNFLCEKNESRKNNFRALNYLAIFIAVLSLKIIM